MTGGIEAAGEFATGVAWSRAAEPAAGEDMAVQGHATAHGGACLNCGTMLGGRYCSACGQSAHVHRTLISIVHDLAHGVFHFEGKIWRTVPMLVLHPGQLTRRYIAGERARFVSPLALFLFTVFLMFAVYSAVGSGTVGAGLAQGWNSTGNKLEQVRRDNDLAIAAAERDRAERIASHQPTGRIDRRLRNLHDDQRAMAAVRQRVTPTDDTVRVHSSIGWLDKGIQHARENPGLTIYKVQSAAYKFSWTLIFLSTPFVALLFVWRRRFGLYDHATFVTYSIASMSLLVIVLELMSAADAPEWTIGALAMLAPPAHMFTQLRGAYSLSVFSALWRTVLLLLFAFLVLALFVLGVVAMEVAH